MCQKEYSKHVLQDTPVINQLVPECDVISIGVFQSQHNITVPNNNMKLVEGRKPLHVDQFLLDKGAKRERRAVTWILEGQATIWLSGFLEEHEIIEIPYKLLLEIIKDVLKELGHYDRLVFFVKFW